MVVSKVTRGHHTKGTDGGQGAGLRASQSVSALASVVDDLTLRSTRQIEVTHEHVPRIECARIVIALGPTGIIAVVPTIG
jgi:hypothetical protein